MPVPLFLNLQKKLSLQFRLGTATALERCNTFHRADDKIQAEKLRKLISFQKCALTLGFF